MKKTAFLFAFLVFFTGYQGFAFGKKQSDPKPDVNNTIQGDIKKINDELVRINGDIKDIKDKQVAGSAASTAATERILVTPEIVQYLLQNNVSLDGLKFYPSNKFTLEIYEQKENSEIKNENGMIILNSTSSVAEPRAIEISKESEGIWTGVPEPDKGGRLQISFQEKGKKINLIFRRNIQQNCYELFEANDVTKNYNIKFSEPILLYVSGRNNRKAQAVPSDNAFINEPAYQKIPAGGSSDNYPYGRPVNFSRSVMGAGSLKPESVIAYVKKKNPSFNNNNMNNVIINAYFKEAGIEGVNADFAVAQMLYWTNYLKNRERVATCNYGGLSGIGDFKGDFKGNITKGVRAHIQHLKAYAHVPLLQENVDPRYQLAYDRGFTGISFDQVCRNWSRDPEYGQKIENILRELYNF